VELAPRAQSIVSKSSTHGRLCSSSRSTVPKKFPTRLSRHETGRWRHVRWNPMTPGDGDQSPAADRLHALISRAGTSCARFVVLPIIVRSITRLSTGSKIVTGWRSATIVVAGSRSSPQFHPCRRPGYASPSWRRFTSICWKSSSIFRRFNHCANGTSASTLADFAQDSDGSSLRRAGRWLEFRRRTRRDGLVKNSPPSGGRAGGTDRPTVSLLRSGEISEHAQFHDQGGR
jgi:hypothetical protein